MVEPIATLTASAIIQIAFNEFVKSGSGELAKKSITGSAALIKKLQRFITEKFKSNPLAEKALVRMTEKGDEPSLEKVAKYLDIEMMDDESFSNSIQKLAQEINNYQSSTYVSQTNNNFGRDQNVINQPQGDIRIGG